MVIECERWEDEEEDDDEAEEEEEERCVLDEAWPPGLGVDAPLLDVVVGSA